MMLGSQVPIPAEFQSQLRYVLSKDIRTGAEVLDALGKDIPITSGKSIWKY